MAVKLSTETTKGRAERIFLVAAVVLVQLFWGATLVYLLVHFL